MNENYIVYTELFTEHGIERWYYGTYSHTRANEVALQLGHNPAEGCWHCVCPAEEAEEWGILNMPRD